MYIHIHADMCLQRSEEGVGSRTAGDIDGNEPPDVVPENPTHILCRNSRHSLTTELSPLRFLSLLNMKRLSADNPPKSQVAERHIRYSVLLGTGKYK